MVRGVKMKTLGFFKKNKGMSVYAPCSGKSISLKEVPDPTFADEMLGKGIAIVPNNGKFYSPGVRTSAVLRVAVHWMRGF